MGAAGAAPADARVTTECSHCGLVVPPGLVVPDADRQFCCTGCQTVYGILHSEGLEQYYRVRDAVDAPGQRPQTSGSRYEEYDDPAFAAAVVSDSDQEGVGEAEFLLDGVHCAACVWLVERLPRVLPGVIDARVHIRTRIARIRFDREQVPLSKIARTLDSLGYAPNPARGRSARDARTREDRTHLIRVAVAGALAGNIMLLAIALYGGEFTGMTQGWQTLFRWVSMLLGLVSLLWPGRVFIRGAIAALRTRTAHLDLPIALALTAGGIWGVVNTVRGTGEIYFDSLGVLVFLLLVGRWVQHRQQRSASDRVELMLTLTATTATLVEGDTTRRVPIESVSPGDTIEVAPGDSIPADGVVEIGMSSIDSSLLTGESRPIAVAPGSTVAAGASNISGTIRVRVQAVGEHTRIGRLMALVSDASARKAPIVQLADRIAGVFVMVVIALAIATVLVWAPIEGWHEAIEHATALLIISCPCALGLATPMAMSVALGRAAKQHALVKSAAALEALAKPTHIVLDKTGTLTRGSMQVAWFQGVDALRSIAGALEADSPHPVADAIRRACDEPMTLTDIEHVPGGGITGMANGKPCAIGSPRFIESISGSDTDQEAINRSLAEGHSPVLVWCERIGTGVFAVGDLLRDDTSDALQRMRSRGWLPSIASGDDPVIVERVACELDLDNSSGGLSPEDKTKLVGDIKKKGPVVMVGDGVNDAAALASATVGIAVHGGAEASLDAADVYLSKPGLGPLVDLLGLADHTRRTVRLCLMISIAYNTIGATLAMMGLINALVAAVVMPISSLVVVSVALRPMRRIG